LRAFIEHLGFHDRDRVELEARTSEAVETAQIEDEPLSRVAVRSSIGRRLHLAEGGALPADAKAEGVVDMTLDATVNYAAPLTIARLHRWHAGLFPIDVGNEKSLTIGRFRNDARGAMQVVSGRIDEPTVRFEAPPAARIAAEMELFLSWFEAPSNMDGLIRSALGHLYFLTIHPYDDGNGRIARAIGDMALARDDRSSRRFFSMSQQIRAEKKRYYDVLERTQKGDLDATEWLVWFLESYTRAIHAVESSSSDVLRAQAFWRRHEAIPFSQRQRTVLMRYVTDFEGKLTAKKWSVFGKASVDTAQRDIADLVEKAVLIKNPGGSKNTSYSLVGYDT
jgi:Fic family protein